MTQTPLASSPFILPKVRDAGSAVVDSGDSAKNIYAKFPVPQGVSPCEVLLLTLRRPVVYDNLITTLGRGGVAVHLCRGTREIQQILKSHTCVAILLDATGENQELPISAEDIGGVLSRHDNLRLIALLPPATPPSQQLQDFLQNGWLYDFHTAPFDARRLLYCLGHLNGLVQLERKYMSEQKVTKTGYGHIIGTSPRMQRIYESIWRISKVDTPVLLTGESGTGKELIARTIHDRSAFRNGQFVAVNCAALPPNLIASELFGHEQGAFTGASRLKRGLVEEAHDGTLFLDEIGDMPLELQPHFLRFLQDGSFKRVGGTTSLKIRMKIVSATNVDLKDAMLRGQFREDLYYRLNVLALEVPPLRERENDIEILADYYLQKFSVEYNRPRMRLSSKAISALVQYVWPGNVRELVSAISRAVIMTKGTLIKPEDLGLCLSPIAPAAGPQAHETQTLFEARDAFDRNFIALSIEHNNQNILRTARALGISRVALYRLMKRHGLMRKNKDENFEGSVM